MIVIRINTFKTYKLIRELFNHQKSMSTNTLKLNNNQEIPIIGLGTYKASPGVVGQAVKDAIDIGYRHIDCAWYYLNEAEIGQALREKFKDGTVKRENMYITTKLWNNFHEKKCVVPKLKECLEALKLDYVDLFLIHWPFGFKEDAAPLPPNSSFYSDVDYLETWEGMEECVKLGLTKSIGVSNFNNAQLDRVLKNCKIKPVVNQVEVNPNFNQQELIEFCKERNVVVTAFCPLGRGSGFVTNEGAQSNLDDPKIAEIGKKYNKTAAQVILQYLVNMGISVIPKSTTKSRIKENFEILDFKLDPKDIDYLDSCNKNMRVSGMTAYKDHKYYPF